MDIPQIFELPRLSLLGLGLPYLTASALAGFLLLLVPDWQLYKLQEGRLVTKLFDSASYYSMAQLANAVVFVLLS